MTTRKISPVQLSDAEASRFVYGLCNHNGYRAELSNAVFAKTRQEFGEILSECQAPISLYPDLYELLRKVKSAMPFLDFYPHETTNRGVTSVVAIHKGSDYPSGLISYCYYGEKLSVSSPLTYDKRSGAQSTKNVGKALTLAKTWLKYVPPSAQQAYIGLAIAYQERAFGKYLLSLKRSRDTLTRMLVTDNFRSCAAGTSLSLTMFNYLCDRDDLPSEMADAIAEYRKVCEEYDNYKQYSTNLLYVRSGAGEFVTYCLVSGQESRVITPDLYSQPEGYGVMVRRELPTMPDGFVVRLAELVMANENEYVPHVGMRLSKNEFVMYAHDIADQLVLTTHE